CASIEQPDCVNAVTVPVTSYRKVGGQPGEESEVDGRVVVAEHDLNRRRSKEPNAIYAVAIPITRNRKISCLTKSRADINRWSRPVDVQSVGEQERSIAKHANRIDSVAVPVTDDRQIPRLAKVQCDRHHHGYRHRQATNTRAVKCGERSAQQELTRRRSKHAGLVIAISVPVADDRQIPGCAEINRQVGVACAVRIAKQEISGRGTENSYRIVEG